MMHYPSFFPHQPMKSRIFFAMPGKQVDQEIRGAIIALHCNTSLSTREIAAQYGISHQSVANIIKRYESEGNTSIKTRSGRPKATTPRVDALIRRQAVKNPFITSAQIKRNLAVQCSNVTTRTIRNRLCKEFKMPARKAVKKPIITSAMRKKRLQFCEKYKNYTIEQWKKVMFSDESSFQINNCPNQTVRRPVGSSPVNPRYTKKTSKHPASVMVWGCFSHNGRGGLTLLNSNQRLNTDGYIKILEEKLAHFMCVHGCTIFQQDNAPCHCSKKALKWFQDNNIELLDWPSNSPDLNPIEHLWSNMKRKLSEIEITSISQLKEEIKRVWCLETTAEECQKLAESMPRRIEAVIRNRGYPTKYWTRLA